MKSNIPDESRYLLRMRKERFKHKGLKIKRFGTLIMFFVPKEVSKSRVYFTDFHYLKGLLYGTKQYMYASIWYHQYERIQRKLANAHNPPKVDVEGSK